MSDIYGTEFNDNDTSQWNGSYYEYFPSLSGDYQNDNIYGFSGDDNLWGYDGNDYMDGGAGNDWLWGWYGNDILRGWSGADLMQGGPGNDTYYVENLGDRVEEYYGEGTDTVSSSITYTLPSYTENLTLTGNAKINGTGNSEKNTIIGNSGINQLYGSAGNDILDGKGSFDKLTGGTGNDIFKFTVKGPADMISDYNVANDTIQLDNSAFTRLTNGTLNASQFKVGTHATDSNDFIVYNKATGALLYDVDGNGGAAAVGIANVNPGLNLTNADIFVI